MSFYFNTISLFYIQGYPHRMRLDPKLKNLVATLSSKLQNLVAALSSKLQNLVAALSSKLLKICNKSCCWTTMANCLQPESNLILEPNLSIG